MDEAAVVCVDVGSTFTKALLVEVGTGELLAKAEHPTTIDTDVMDGLDACRAVLTAQDPRAASARTLACSSAGGGLKIAVLGNEELVTAEAGRRVALSSGGKVVAVIAASTAYDGLTPQLDADVVLLTGGTDGGNAEAAVDATRRLVASGWRGPVVVAASVDARPEIGRLLDEADLRYVVTANVVPRIGQLAPQGARTAIREMFLAHVIGGKGLSRRPEFVELVRGATPDLVLTGVELLAEGLDQTRPGAGDVVVVDVGGATTDVHSVVELDPEATGEDGLAREVVAPTRVTRTVEGDLGMRWSAASTVQAAGRDDLAAAAARRRADPAYLPDTEGEAEIDEQLAAAAIGLALRRHAGRSRIVVSPEGRVVERTGTDLREVTLLIGSGGILRNGRAGVAGRVLAGHTGADFADGWQLPRQPRVVVDHDYVLAAAGLLASAYPETAYRLVSRLTARR